MRAEANGGMTTIEVLASTASVILLFALGCTTAIRAETKSKGAVCAVRLRELGIALSDYAEEHNKLLPWQVPKSSGGTLEDVLAPSSVHLHYRALSNYALPWRLVCPQDERVSVASWDSLSDSNISYFVNLTVRWEEAKLVVAGDRYLTTNSTMMSGLLDVKPNTKIRWAKQFHNHAGNLLFNDRSVQLITSNLVERLATPPNNATARLSIP